MIKVREVLQAYLKTIHPRVYFQVAPESAQFPYIVFDFPTTFDDGESQEIITVDVDGWGNSKDTKVLETLMTNINGDSNIGNPSGLNKRTLNAEGMAANFYLDAKLSLIDDDKRVRRRKYIYEAKIFWRS